MPPPLPQRIGPYAITRVLGQGGMGVVYCGTHVELGVERAIKVMLRGDARALARFERETTHLASVSHPNVVRIHEAGVHQGQPFFAMNFVDGRPLDVALRERRLPLRVALGWAAGICRGVDALHELGVIHRDLKPANVLITSDGRPVVVDVGLAVAPELDDRLTKTGAFVGTVTYMAPEQLSGGGVTPRADVFALGLILFELVTGSPAVTVSSTVAEVMGDIVNRERPRPGDVDASLPARLDAVCARATARDPAARYARAGELAAALEDVLRSPGPPRRAVVRRRRALLVTLGAVALAALAGAVAVAQRGDRAARRAADPTVDAGPALDDRAARRLADERLRRLRERPEADRSTSAYLSEALAWLRDFADHPQAPSLRAVVRATARRVPLATLGPALRARFVPGGRALTLHPRHGLTLWDLTHPGAPRALHSWPQLTGVHLQLAPDGERAYLSDGRLVVSVDLRALDAPATALFKGDIRAMALSSDGATLATGDGAGRVRLVSLATVAVSRTLPPLTTPIYSLAFSRRGHRLFVGNWGALQESRTPMVRVYDPAVGTLLREVPVVGSCCTIVFSPDDRVAAVGTNMGRIFLVPVDDGDARPAVLVGEGRPSDVATFITEPRAAHGAIGGLVFSRDGRGLTSASAWDEEHSPGERLGDLSVWDLEAGREVRERSLVQRATSMSDVDVTPDGQLLLVACSDDPAELWLRSEEEE